MRGAAVGFLAHPDSAHFPKAQIIVVLVSVQNLVERATDFLYLAFHIKPHDCVIVVGNSDIGL